MNEPLTKDMTLRCVVFCLMAGQRHKEKKNVTQLTLCWGSVEPRGGLKATVQLAVDIYFMYPDVSDWKETPT